MVARFGRLLRKAPELSATPLGHTKTAAERGSTSSERRARRAEGHVATQQAALCCRGAVTEDEGAKDVVGGDGERRRGCVAVDR